MDVLVISPCSSDKRYDAEIGCETVDERSREDLIREYPESVAPAAEMYIGDEHRHVQSAVNFLRQIADVDWYIISAGFGLLREDTEIPSYECAFSDMESVRTRAQRAGVDVEERTNNETLRALGRQKGITRRFNEILEDEYDLVFVILGKPYLISVADGLSEIPERTQAYAFASEGSRSFIGDCVWLPATESERQALGTTWMRLRGKQFEQFASRATEQQLQEAITNSEPVRNLNS
jgi:hypothetical protein